MSQSFLISWERYRQFLLLQIEKTPYCASGFFLTFNLYLINFLLLHSKNSCSSRAGLLGEKVSVFEYSQEERKHNVIEFIFQFGITEFHKDK